MLRRSVLTGIGTGALLAVAGCSTRQGVHVTQQTSNPQLESVVVEVYLRNRGKSPAQATLHVAVEMDGGDTYEKTRGVRVTTGPQGATNEQFRFDVGRQVGTGDYSVETWLTDVTYESETTTE